MTAVMSTSLNVVRIAAVCCACTSRSAMRFRRRLSGTRLFAFLAGGAARPSPARRHGRPAPASRPLAPAARCRTPPRLRSADRAALVRQVRSTSPLVRRPPFPDAWMAAGSRACSSIRWRTAGLSGSDRPTARRGAARRSGAAEAARPRCGAGGRRRRRRRRRGGAAAGAAATPCRRRGALARILEPRDHLADRDGRAGFLDDPQHAGALGGDLHARLVGLELEQDLVGARRARRPASPSGRSTPSVTDSPSVGICTSNAIPSYPPTAFGDAPPPVLSARTLG